MTEVETQPTILELYSIISKLENKIDKLNDKLNHLSLKDNSFIAELPEQTIYEWIDNARVNDDHLNILFCSQKGYLEGFKTFILNNRDQQSLPITVHKRRLYICVAEDEQYIWKKITNEHLHKIIQIIWQMFLKYYIDRPKDASIIEDLHDVHMKKVMQMRQHIDVETNRKYLIKWLCEIV